MDSAFANTSSPKWYSSRSAKIRIAVATLTFLVAGFFIWKFVNQYLIRSRADVANPVNITMTPSKSNVQFGEQFTVDVVLNPMEAGKKISAVDLNFNIDKTLVDFVSYTDYNYFQSTLNGQVYNGEVINTLSGAENASRLVLTANKSDDQLTPNNVTTVKLTFTFRAKSTNGNFIFSVNKESSQIVGTNGTGPVQFGISTTATTQANVIIGTLPSVTPGGVTGGPTITQGGPTLTPGATAPTTTPIPGQTKKLFLPYYLKNWPSGEGAKRQWSHINIVNPNKQAANITVNIYPVDPANGAPVKTINKFIQPNQHWTSEDESSEWYNTPNIPYNDGTTTTNDGFFGWVEVLTDQPLAISNRVMLSNSTTPEGTVDLFDDESFTENLSKTVYGVIYTKKVDTGDSRYKQHSDLVIVNPNTSATNATVTVYETNGTVLGTFTVAIPAKGAWRSFERNEWKAIASNATSAGGWLKVTSDSQPIFGATRVKVNETDDVRSKIIAFDDELLVADTQLSNKLYSSQFLKRVPTSNGLRQWSHVVLYNPQSSVVTATIRVRKPEGGVIGAPLTVQINPNSAWNSYVKDEWHNIPDTSTNGASGWVEIESSQPILGMNRVTFRKATGSRTPTFDNTYRADLEKLSDDRLVTLNELHERLAAPVYLQYWPTPQSSQKQWTNLNINNPNNSTAQIIVRVRRVDTGALLTIFGDVIPANGSWNAFGKDVWQKIQAQNVKGVTSANLGWIEVISDKKVFASVRTTFRDDQGAATYNSAVTLFDDESNVISKLTNGGPINPSCSDVNCPPGYTCRDGQCFPPTCNATTPCPPGYNCQNGKCFPPVCNFGVPCPPGYNCQNGVCLPPKCDDNIVCPVGYACVNGTCQGADATLKLKLRFQGITGIPPADINKFKVKVGIGGGNLSTPKFSEGEFKATSPGIWEGSVSFGGVQPGENYYILVKGEKHLQKKICDMNKVEEAGSEGTYTCTDYAVSFIKLNKGVNELDFSGIYMLAGDLAISPGQNGVIDSVDITYLRSKLATQNPPGDLNLDSGRVDVQDHSLPIKVFDLGFNQDDE